MSYATLHTLNSICLSSTGLSCSKLTVSLVNVSLNLWSLNMAYTQIFCWKKNKQTKKRWVAKATCICKSYSHFFSAKIPVDIVLTTTFNILTTNELVKLTMLWTTETCSLRFRLTWTQRSPGKIWSIQQWSRGDFLRPLLLCGFVTLLGTRGTWRQRRLCYVHAIVQPCFHGSPKHILCRCLLLSASLSTFY